MKYVSAYLMLVLGGNDTPSTDQVKAVLTSVGIEADEAQLTKFMSTVEGKPTQNATECINKGLVALESLVIGGGGGGGGGAGGAAAEEAVEEEEEEEEEEVEVGNMFGGDDDDAW